MFHREGQKIILSAFFIVIITVLIAQFYIDIPWLRWLLQIASIVILVLILQFFEGIPNLPTSRNCGAIFKYRRTKVYYLTSLMWSIVLLMMPAKQ